MPPQTVHLTLDSRLDELDRLADAIETFCAAVGVPHEASAFAICADEIFTNIVTHTFGGAAGHSIDITLGWATGGVSVEIVDDGPFFDPTVAPTPDLTTGIEDRDIGGLGLHLVSTLMNRFCYRREEGRNCVAFSRAPRTKRDD